MVILRNDLMPVRLPRLPGLIEGLIQLEKSLGRFDDSAMRFGPESGNTQHLRGNDAGASCSGYQSLDPHVPTPP